MNKRSAWLRTLVLLGAFAGLLSTAAYAAAPKVVTVPWRGALDLQHETYNGKSIHLKGVARGVTPGATAYWTFNDNSVPATQAVPVNPDANGYCFNLGITHTYPISAPGTPFTSTLTVCNGSECASSDYRVVVRTRSLDTEINIAIDEGLWYSHRTQTRNNTWQDGGWFSQGDVSPTAGNVQAFQINNHFEGNDPDKDPYADTVGRGLKFLFSRLVASQIGNVQIWENGSWQTKNPDSNGNSLGIDAHYSYIPYETGQVMDAIVSSKTPAKLSTTGPNGAALPTNIGNRSYKDIVQDMVDMYAWGQYKTSGGNAGGWRYGWNQGPDNSACQWAAIGILAARDIFGCTVPDFVYSENLKWLSYSQWPAPPAYAKGYGYTGSGSGPALSPSGLIQCIMDGVQKTDANRWVDVENNLAANWNGWYRNNTNEYALYALAKAMRLALPSPIVRMAQGTANEIDWFKADCANPDACNSSTDKWGIARTILNYFNNDGQYTGNYYVSGPLRHAWGVIILTGSLHLEPVAVATANPNPGANGLPVNFDGSGSFHQDPTKHIVSYEWDFDNNGTTDASGMTAAHTFNCASLPCSYPVILKVTDDNSPPLVATSTITVQVTKPPHPPTANAGGPYLACVNESFKLDGSRSFDVDAPQGDAITAFGWEIDLAQPYNFSDAIGVSPTTTYGSAGLKDVGLKVTDNSSMFYPGQPNLTDQSFTTATVWDCSCIGPLAARAKPGKIDVTWAPVAGAASYDIYRSTTGSNTGFSLIKSSHVTTYCVFADSGLVNGTTYWYRVVPKSVTGANVCGGSTAASAKPMAR